MAGDLFGGLPATRPPGFEELWLCWPKNRKVGEEAARRAYRNSLKEGVTHEFLIERALVYAESVSGVEPKFILHMSTWLNGKRYKDELEPENGTGSSSSGSRGDARQDDLRGYFGFTRQDS